MISISTYNLTATTKLIMDYLWDFPEGTSFREIYKHFTEVKGRDWKRQTLYTYLTILMEQGFLRTEGSRRRTSHVRCILYHVPSLFSSAYQRLRSKSHVRST